MSTLKIDTEKGIVELHDDEEEFVRQHIGPKELYTYLTAPFGHFAGLYRDGSFSTGESVGKEIDTEERPVALVKCPGIENIETSFWTDDWTKYDNETGKYSITTETEGYSIGDKITLDDCIRVCCEQGDVDNEIIELQRILADEACARCKEQIISEWNPKAQDQDLCDDCFDKLFKNDEDDFIG